MVIIIVVLQGAQGVYIDSSGNEFYCGKTDEKWHIWPRFGMLPAVDFAHSNCAL